MAGYEARRRHRQPFTKLQEIEEDYRVEQRALKNKFIDDWRKKQSQFRGEICRMQRRQQQEREHRATDHARRRRSLEAGFAADIYDLTQEYRGQRLREEKYAAAEVHEELRALQRRRHRDERLALEDGHYDEIEDMKESHRRTEFQLLDREQKRDKISQQRYMNDRRAAVELGW